MKMENVQILKDWVIPFAAIALALWLAASAKKDMERAESILKQVQAAIEGWQNKIMESTKSILDSTPQVVEGRVKMAKIEAAHLLISSIQVGLKETMANPQPGASGHTQTENLKEAGNQLMKILDSMK
jgi:hypothetical protein